MKSEFLFGAAYYPEYMPCSRLEKDIQMMKEAGMNVLRIAESTWSTLEPREGTFDFSYIDSVLDMAEKNSINIIIATPSYAIPSWLQPKEPEVMVETKSGREAYGRRQLINLLNPTFRRHAEQVIRVLVEHTAGRSCVIGYQIDNETLNDRLPRICLQPVVENALTHGLRNTRRKDKKLLIRAEHIGENLVITIADNGTGMDAEAMNVLLERYDRNRVETGVSIGILNVNARLKQLFGAEYGLWIQSQVGEGTTVTITVPIVYSEENDGETGGAHYAKNEI